MSQPAQNLSKFRSMTLANELYRNYQTNELTIFKGKKVIATTPAQLEERDPGRTAYVTRADDNDPSRANLLNVTLSDGKKAVIGNSANGSAAQ